MSIDAPDRLAPVPTTRPESLGEVIKQIPKSCYARSTARGLGLIARDLTLYAAALTGLVFFDSWWLVIPLWGLAIFSVSALFVLGHDAAHEALFDSKRLNGLFGRLLLLPSLHLFNAWRLGHNHIHHRHTTKQGLDFVWHPTTPQEYDAMGRGRRLRHRFEWSAFGPGFYYLTRIWWDKMVRLTPPSRWTRRIRNDRIYMTICIVLATVGAGALGGLFSGDIGGAVWMTTKLLVVPFLGFIWFIGWTVYVHHIGVDMPWAKRREWSKVEAQLETTTVLRVPPAVNLFLHSIFVHVPHHVDTRIPCYKLSEATAAIEAAYPGIVVDEKLTWRGYLRTTRDCKLFDFDERRWLDYSAGALLVAHERTVAA